MRVFSHLELVDTETDDVKSEGKEGELPNMKQAQQGGNERSKIVTTTTNTIQQAKDSHVKAKSITKFNNKISKSC